MSRLLVAFVALVFAVGPSLAAPPAGSWKVRLPLGEKSVSLLIAFSMAEGKWVGDFIDSRPALKTEPKFTSVTLNQDALQFVMTIGGKEFITFDGIVAKDGRKITGSYSLQNGPLQLLEFQPTRLKKFDDAFDINRETFDQIDGTPADLFEIGFELLPAASAKKLTVEEVRGLVDRISKAAATYGPRWDRNTAVRIAGLLVDQPGYSEVALAQARRAERLLAESDPIADRLDILEMLSRCLIAAKKPDEAKPLAAQMTRLIARDAAEYAKSLPFGEVKPYAGRKAKSNRIVLVDGFAGTEFSLSAPIEQTLDALSKAYDAKDVIVLNSHYHLPEPTQGDPLTVPETSERLQPIVEQVQRGQFLYVAGKPGPRITNPSGAKEFFEQVRTMIDEQLEKPAGCTITLTATKTPKGTDVKAVVNDLDVGSNKLALRFAVVEPRVRYPGGSGVRYHVNVVRALPGGGKGYPLTKKQTEQNVVIAADEIRTNLTRYLADFAKGDGEFARPARPMDLKDLKLIAFVQNDSTGEILTAAMIGIE